MKPDVEESRNASLEALKEANSPDARSVVLDLESPPRTSPIQKAPVATHSGR